MNKQIEIKHLFLTRNSDIVNVIYSTGRARKGQRYSLIV